MPDYKYLIIGGGMTAAAAIEGIREVDKEGTIGLVSSENHPPYDRPPLSKKLWKGEPFDSIWRKTDGPGVTLHLGRNVTGLAPEGHRVTDEEGTVYGYQKLLLATGAAPRRLPFGDEVIYFRTVDDYNKLKSLTTQAGKRYAVIGGGFIGSEVAAALAMNGEDVTMAFPDEGIGARLFPHDLVSFLNDYYRKNGVIVKNKTTVENISAEGASKVLSMGEEQVKVDHVIAGIGVVPNVDLAQAAGLEVDNGIKVDAHLRTSNPDIYAAGDVASQFNKTLNEWRRVEHEDNANVMGKAAGAAMAGREDEYDYLPFFYSDLFDLGFEAVGEVDSRLQMVADWTTPFEEGVVYYLKEGRVRGVLLWNVWDQVPAARKLIAEPGPFSEAKLKGRLPA